jgi:hypothetical protein
MLRKSLLAVAAVFAFGLGVQAATPTLDVTFDRPQTIKVGKESVTLAGEFKDGFWTYGKKALAFPAQSLLGKQGTILYRFKISEFKEAKMGERDLMALCNAGPFYFTVYMCDQKRLNVAFCNNDVRNYYTFPEEIKMDVPYIYAAAWDGNSLRLYLNGVQTEEIKQTFQVPNVLRHISFGPYIDGSRNPAPWGDDCHAGFVKTYNVALSSEEISALSGAKLKPIADQYPQMLTVGKLVGDAPVVDGDLSDKAWQVAGGMINFTDGNNGPKSWAMPPSSFLLTYDDKSLYLGLRTLFPGHVPIKQGALRDATESDVWGTESFEFYLQINGTLYRFGGNVAGGYVESKGMDTSYSGPWTYKSSIKMRIDDRFLWQAEAAIPWSSLGLSGAPTAPIKFNVCRSWYLPETSTSSALTPDGQYQTVATFPSLVFAPATAALQVIEQNDPSGGRFEQSLQVAGSKDGEVEYQILLVKKNTSAVPYPLYKGKLSFKAGAPATQKLDVPISRTGFESLVFTLSEGGKVVLCQMIPFHLNEEYVAIKPNFLKTTVTLQTKVEQLRSKFGADFKGKLKVTGPDGAQVAQLDASATGADSIPFPRSSPAGNYKVELLNAKDGSLVDVRTFSYPGVGEWEKLTFDNRIIPPFTALQVKAGAGELEAAVWGRSYQWNKSLLPTQIVTQGDKFLASPATIEINGAAVPEADFKNGSSAPHRTEFSASAKTDSYELAETAWMEYDGVQHGTFTLKALKDLKNVKLKVTLPAELVKFLHTSNDYNWGTKRSETVEKGYNQTFRFYPVVWLGGYESGLCIFAESNATWKGDPGRAITITDDGTTAVYSATLADDLKAGETLPFDFGFLASPVKALARNYPLDIFSDEFAAKMNRPGRTPTAWCIISDNGLDPLGGFFCDIPTPEQSQNAPDIKEYIDVAHAHGTKGMPYFMARFLSQEYPEVAAFKDSWKISPEQSLDYERLGKKYYVTEMCPFSSGTDFYMWKTKEYLKRIPSDGIYFDFGLPSWCSNAEHGCHNRNTLLGQREFYRKIVICLLDSGVKDPIIVVHNTDSISLPAFTFVTHLFNGENIRQHSSNLMHNGKDLLDTYDVTHFACELGSLPFGLNNSIYHAQDLLLPEFGGTNENPDLYKFRLTKAVVAGAIVHNTLPSPQRLHFGVFDKIVRIFDKFGVPDAKFIGYWRKPATVKAGKDIYVSVYRQASGKKALAVISHIGREHLNQDLEIVFNSDVLGLKPFNSATEMLTAPDKEYDELFPVLKAISDVSNGQGQEIRTPIKLGDFGCSVTSIKDNVLKMKLNFHSFALVELE